VRVVEQFVRGKLDDPSLCEDAVVVTPGFAAVVDGATDVSGRSYAGVTGGRWAMLACVDAIQGLPPEADAETAVAALSAELANRIDPATPVAERPSASVTLFSAARREVWQVGDVGFRWAGRPAPPRKRVDEIAVAFRVAVVAAEVAAGTISLNAMTGDDPGRAAARPLLARQGFFRNTPGPYGYAAVDGRPVPGSLMVVRPVPSHVRELTIASDGYPVIENTLAESEATLTRLLARDPWCVGELAGTKGVRPGQVSFDDRAYLRLSLEPFARIGT
jgi:hypothetical protein